MRVTARWKRSTSRSVLDYQGSYEVKLGGKPIATVMHARDPFSPDPKRRAGYWFFYGTIPMPDGTEVRRNTASTESWDTAELARDACITWIKATLVPALRPETATGGGR